MVTAVVKSSEGDEGTFTKSSIPSKLNACPTSPGAKVVPRCSVPGLPSQISLALPSPGHQLTMFEGGGTHCGLHLPALPALTIAWISACESARLKYSTSSISPGKVSILLSEVRL